MKINKKIIISIVIGIALIATTTAGTILVLNSVNSQNKEKSVQNTEKSVNGLREKAEASRENNELEESKKLLLEAQQQVKEFPESDEKTNTAIDIEAQLSMLGDKPSETE